LGATAETPWWLRLDKSGFRCVVELRAQCENRKVGILMNQFLKYLNLFFLFNASSLIVCAAPVLLEISIDREYAGIVMWYEFWINYFSFPFYFLTIIISLIEKTSVKLALIGLVLLIPVFYILREGANAF
jgi:hypothetical protein